LKTVRRILWIVGFPLRCLLFALIWLLLAMVCQELDTREVAEAVGLVERKRGCLAK